MEFEFDEKKSRTNFEKHGIDFTQAKRLWEGPSIEFAAKEGYKNRFAIIGEIDERFYTCIYTLRENRKRIISCRTAREKERKLYEENIKKT